MLLWDLLENWCFPLISSIFDKYVRRSSLFAEVFKNIFSTEHLRWLLLNLEYVLLCNFNKIELFLCRVMTRIILESIIVSIIINIS